MGETIRLIVTDAMLLNGQHVEPGEILDLPQDKAAELLASGRVRRATAADEAA